MCRSIRAVVIGTFGLMLCVSSRPSPGQISFSAGSPAAVASPSMVHRYLRQPNGIEKLSAVVGNVSLAEADERWGDDSVSSLTGGSDLVVEGTILNIVSYLSADGDSIESTYTVQVHEVLKGARADQVAFRIKGGTVTLKTGNMATLHTPGWDGLKRGQKYLLFMRSENGMLTLVSGSHGALCLNIASNRAELVDRSGSADSRLANELGKASIASIEDDIHNMAIPH